eukprot:12616542-Alexandrium_andersonii.AAC.1
MPQASWGHQAKGMPPSEIRSLRAMASNALGLSTKGCTTTAVALLLGPDRDPAVRVRRELLAGWVVMWHERPECRERLTVVWHRQARKLVPRTRWLNVRGPAAAVQATLRDIGWTPLGPVWWRSDVGEEWAYTGTLHGLSAFVAAIEASVSRALWRRAAGYEGGGGLENGCDLLVVSKSLAFYRKAEMTAQSGMLITTVTGACWPAQRRAEAGYSDSPLCPRCLGEPETLVHRFWRCSANADIDDPAVRCTQDLRSRAVRDAAEY